MCNNHLPINIDQNNHDQEHKYWSRRSFLQALGIAGSGTMMLGSNMLSASAPSPLTAAIANADTDCILILIRLSGGNDGLSTVIPIKQYDSYANARPDIYIPESKILRLRDECGIPTYMNALEPMWGDGQFKAVHGVGYENQSLSHFTGSDIYANTDLIRWTPETGRSMPMTFLDTWSEYTRKLQSHSTPRVDTPSNKNNDWLLSPKIYAWLD